ncbi:hypothetical protein WG954_03860 [Lacibacter sp. H375]|uniref:hypothetical protein n=1 Tax=Lacibacter sp. H375 TaxID=3133424 RepID=UPI0030BFC21D
MNEMKFPKEEIELLFYECYSSVEEKTILELNEREVNGNICNVVVGLAKHCYCTFLLTDSKDV